MANSQPTQPLGDLLRQIRTQHGLTQEDLADLAPGGLSVDTVSNIERGRVRPRRHTLEAILDAMGVDGPEREQILGARASSNLSESQGGSQQYFPTPLTPLVGRETELDSLRSLLSAPDTRVVTLTGPGGVGKTRLALAAATDVRAGFADGCEFVDLTPLRDPDQLLASLAFGLGLADFGDRPMQERIVAFLRAKDVLLLLDNAETAVAAAASLPPILEACPGVRLLVTSREALRLRGEFELSVPPLELPSTGTVVEELSMVPSVALFLQRARMVSPDVALSEENASVIARICSRLDGLPLALELAAARLRHLSIETLAARLDHALGVLVEGPRDLPERQRTLRATIDWSFDQLSETEQRVLRRLSVFADGFSDVAAAEICSEVGAMDAGEVEIALDGLLDKSLLSLSHESPAGERRLRMLETIREYAADGLRESGEEESVRNRHARFFSDLAEASFPELYSPGRQAWIRTLRIDYGNLTSALAWSLDEAGEAESGLRLAGSLGRFWYFSSNLNEGRHWLRRALEVGTSGEPSLSLARVFYSAGKLAWVQGDFISALPHAEQGAGLAQGLPDELFLAESLTLLGYTLVAAGDHERSLPAFEQSLEIERRLGARWQIAFTLAMASEALRLTGRADEARAYLAEALDTFRSLEDPWGRGVTFAMISGVHSDAGEIDEVEKVLTLAEAAFQDAGDEKYTRTRLAIARGYVYLRLGRAEQSRDSFRTALRSGQEIGLTAYILVAIAGTASLAAMSGRMVEAARLYASASSLLDSDAFYGDDGVVMARAAYGQFLPLLQKELSQADFDAASREGQNYSLDEAVMLAESVLDA